MRVVQSPEQELHTLSRHLYISLRPPEGIGSPDRPSADPLPLRGKGVQGTSTITRRGSREPMLKEPTGLAFPAAQEEGLGPPPAESQAPGGRARPQHAATPPLGTALLVAPGVAQGPGDLWSSKSFCRKNELQFPVQLTQRVCVKRCRKLSRPPNSGRWEIRADHSASITSPGERPAPSPASGSAQAPPLPEARREHAPCGPRFCARARG